MRRSGARPTAFSPMPGTLSTRRSAKLTCERC
ncbi:MAG: hypothetical protein AB7S41_16160 [Parvibaculaceae bacterium]